MKTTTPPKVVINNKDDADAALRQIALRRLRVDALTAAADKQITGIRAKLVIDCADALEDIAAHELALGEWAEVHKEELFKDPRSLQLNFGALGFRWTPWKIAIIGKLKVETIIEKIRAAKMLTLIRTKEEIDKEAALNYNAEDLAKCGLKKTRKDEFYYEIKTEEVK